VQEDDMQNFRRDVTSYRLPRLLTVASLSRC